MFGADDLIAAIHRRQRRSLRPTRTEPASDHGLEAWLGLAGEDSRPHSSRPAGVLAATMGERGWSQAPQEPVAPNRIAAWWRLWRQQWGRAPRDQRGLRWFAVAFSTLLNVGFALALLWLMYLRFVMMLPAQPQAQSAVAGAGAPGDVVVPIRMLSSAGSAASPSPAAATVPAAPARQPPSRSATSPTAAATRTTLALQQVTLAPQQNVRVSEPVAQRVSEFQLPQVQLQPTPAATQDAPLHPVAPQVALHATDTPQLALHTPELQARASAPQLETPVEVQAPTLPTRAVRPVQLDVAEAVLRGGAGAPQLERRAALPGAVTPARLPSVAMPGLATPQLRGTALAPSLRPAPGAGNPSAATASTATPSGTTDAGAPASAGRQASATGPGQRPGSTGLANDDWGRAAAGTGPGRGDSPGSGAGLYGVDGRPNLAAGSGALPADRFTDKVDLASEGRWLRHPPNNYQPTVFDKYWIPSGTLLEEWVRRGVKELSIPVPGSKTRIVCVVSILQLGGACYPSNPDINDQPVNARPPPPVPFKRQYQQAQDALAAPDAPPPPPSPLPPVD